MNQLYVYVSFNERMHENYKKQKMEKKMSINLTKSTDQK